MNRIQIQRNLNRIILEDFMIQIIFILSFVFQDIAEFLDKNVVISNIIVI